MTTKPETQTPKEQSSGLAPDWEGHYSAVIMSAVVSQITGVSIVTNSAMWKIFHFMTSSRIGWPYLGGRNYVDIERFSR